MVAVIGPAAKGVFVRRLLWQLSPVLRRSRRRIARRKLLFNPPDEIEERAKGVLLVWRDLPYWMVVDREFHEFLCSFDGKREAEHLVGGQTGHRRETVTLFCQIEELTRVGVLSASDPDSALDARRRALSPRIENVSVNLTSRCNLRCRFCYNLMSAPLRSEDELTADEIIGFLDTLQGFLGPRPSLFLLGGEPLLCADKVLVVGRFAVAAGFDVIVSTNGTFLTDEFATAAHQAGIQVQVSLDGPVEAIHDALRGSGSYRRALASLKTLVRNRAYTIASMVCLEENLPHIEAFYALAASVGVNEARVIPLKRIGGASQNGTAPVPLSRLIFAMISLLERHPEYAALMGRDCLSILAGQCQMAFPRKSCGTGVQTVLLDADGTLYPCLNTNRTEFAFGNLRESSFNFGAAWRTSPVLERVRRETSVETRDNACADCLVKYWCLGGCHGENYAVNGSLSSRSPDCVELRRAVTEMMWTLSTGPGWAQKLRSRIC